MPMIFSYAITLCIVKLLCQLPSVFQNKYKDQILPILLTSFSSECDVMGEELSKLHCHVGETLRTHSS